MGIALFLFLKRPLGARGKLASGEKGREKQIPHPQIARVRDDSDGLDAEQDAVIKPRSLRSEPQTARLSGRDDKLGGGAGLADLWRGYGAEAGLAAGDGADD